MTTERSTKKIQKLVKKKMFNIGKLFKVSQTQRIVRTKYILVEINTQRTIFILSYEFKMKVHRLTALERMDTSLRLHFNKTTTTQFKTRCIIDAIKNTMMKI